MNNNCVPYHPKLLYLLTVPMIVPYIAITAPTVSATPPAP